MSQSVSQSSVSQSSSGGARGARARVVVLTLLVSNLVWAITLPVSMIDPAGPATTVVVAVVLAACVVLQLLVLRAAVSPWVEPRTRGLLMAGLVVALLAAWPVMYAVARPGDEPWAWLAASVIGASPLALPSRWALAVLAGLGGLSALGAVVWNGSVRDNVIFSVGFGVLTAVLCLVLVWLLRLLLTAEAGREAQANLAVSEERLRLARDLHDVLGHRLTVIALQAEVVGAAVEDDPDGARRGAEEVRRLATTTLRDVRQAVHGYGTLDLGEQLDSARLVLESAGVATTVTAAPVTLDGPASQLLAAVVREGVTNILRHSTARAVTVDLREQNDTVELIMVNDRPVDAASPPGFGLAGLTERLQAVGGRLSTERGDDRFVLRTELVRP